MTGAFSVLVGLTLMLALTISSVNASPTQQAETEFAAIDAYVTEQMHDLGIPGMALGIVQDGQIVHLGGLGAADSSGSNGRPRRKAHGGFWEGRLELHGARAATRWPPAGQTAALGQPTRCAKCQDRPVDGT